MELIIKTNEKGTTVYIDGKEIENVCGIKFEHYGGRDPVVTINAEISSNVPEWAKPLCDRRLK